MKKTSFLLTYTPPVLRQKEFSLEKNILSNTEPIGGKDDPDHDW